jgi:hypothetical protein
VGDLGREALLVAKARAEPFEQSVEGGGELRELVLRFARAEPSVEVVFAPLRGLTRHRRNRLERSRDQPSRGDQD